MPRAPDAPEGDGFVLAVVDRFADKRTDLLILDGNDVSAPADRHGQAAVRAADGVPWQLDGGCLVDPSPSYEGAISAASSSWRR